MRQRRTSSASVANGAPTTTPTVRVRHGILEVVHWPAARVVLVPMATCRCEYALPTRIDPLAAAYAADGTSLTIEGQPGRPYCVRGDTLRVLDPGDATGPWVEVFTRQP